MLLDRKSVSNYKLLTVEEEVGLIHAWKSSGDRAAFERLVMSHARLAWGAAVAYAPNNEAAQKDLAQHGMMGLMHALTKYDPVFNRRFAGYAKLWVRAFVARAASGTLIVVDMPARKYIDAKMGRLKTNEAVAAFGETSFDAPVAGTDGELSVGDTMQSEDPDPEQILASENRQRYFEDRLGKALGALTDRERQILTYRRLGDPGETLEEVGKRFSVTRERIRQIEKIAMQKVRRSLEREGFSAEAFE